MKKVLVIVDPQKDFLDPQGSLYVKNDNLASKIYNHVVDNNYDSIIVTLDSHPLGHCSFARYGGSFPTHCVTSTWGASVCSDIESLYEEFPEKIEIVQKGQNPLEEEFGAFGSKSSSTSVLACCNKAFKDEGFEVYVCGVAGDYCVIETTKNLVKYFGYEKVYLILDLIASIDETKFNDLIVKYNFNVYLN